MNRFVLDLDPIKAAEYHCDKHVVKMILEEAQMLSTVHCQHGYDGDELYKATHKNHPCTAWARETTGNYAWAYRLFVALLEEYTFRYEKVHATSRLRPLLAEIPASLPRGDMTPFPLAMPDDAKTAGGAVLSYRNYYILHKSKIATWNKSRSAPYWFPGNCGL